jgi:hypothetical protein
LGGLVIDGRIIVGLLWILKKQWDANWINLAWE